MTTFASKAEVFENPLEEPIRNLKRAEPCILVIFGATGDLTARKLVPALYNMAREGQLPAHFACVGFARRDKNHDIFRNEMFEAVNQFSRVKPVDPEIWKEFSQCLFYHKSNFNEDEGYDSLHKFLKTLDQQFNTKGNRVYYLSTQPTFFSMISDKLSQHNLVYNQDEAEKWSRVIIEKPFGRDLESSIQLQNEVERCLDESQIYRIDHYLGKETVQNLMAFRFSNAIFEDLWNNHHIDHVQMTVAEDIGIGTRGKLWEESGSLRDIVQNHMMQVLSLAAMEPPISFDSTAIHDEKVKVLESIRAFPMDEFDEYVIRGQYAPGYVDGELVKGYREEDNVSPTSNVETFVALKLHIDNWRWAGVPFYLRTGKHLPKKVTDISVVFKQAPGFLFNKEESRLQQNILSIRIQPDEGISLKMNCKVPGLPSPLQPVKMDFRYGQYFGLEPPEAYERLITDCMAGDRTLFARWDEVLASWKLLDPVLTKWAEAPPKDFPNYPAGSWGAERADKIIENDGREWCLL
ncbi:MAG: Glucose-6-phosphate 1-dehydrogenase 2 [Chlamydiae bacterium]|nr:Glucose-6-phosphate 1-dehydrogenase 2 [Chlamydiota bacterium]